MSYFCSLFWLVSLPMSPDSPLMAVVADFIFSISSLRSAADVYLSSSTCDADFVAPPTAMELIELTAWLTCLYRLV